MESDIRDGILVIDKPADMTSAQVVAVVKKSLRIAKIGHAGTLDPFATGVIICCLNRATRLARFFLHGAKTYDAVLHLGIETDTLDRTGRIVFESDAELPREEDVKAVIQQFKGSFLQAPPIYSALKHEGTPLYKLARKGTPVQKPPKEITIFQISVKEIRIPEVQFRVSCSGGTYIRSLAADIGKKLGCGAHLKELRRIESGGFTLQDAVNLADVSAIQPQMTTARIISMSDALRGMACYQADDSLIKKILHGRTINKQDLTLQHQGFIKVISQENELIAVLQYENEQVRYCCVFNETQNQNIIRRSRESGLISNQQAVSD